MAAQDLDTAIAYYVGRLIYQYQQPRAQATIAILVKQMLADGLPWQLQDCFTLSTAVGKQLDTLGKYVGIPRMIGDPAPLPFFGFVPTYAGGGNMNGMTDYNSGVNNLAIFYQYNYNATASTALSDTAYAFMLLFKIAVNTCDHTLASVQAILKRLTNGNVLVIDNRDMTINYQIGPNIPVSPATLGAYLPRPMGVGVTITATNPIITGTGDNIVTDSGDTIVAGNL